MPAENLTVYAGWSINTYTITLYDGDEYIVSHNDLRMIGLLKDLDIKWY
jgi:hypothetical protein